jgi:hypothetical protein
MKMIEQIALFPELGDGFVCAVVIVCWIFVWTFL